MNTSKFRAVWQGDPTRFGFAWNLSPMKSNFNSTSVVVIAYPETHPLVFPRKRQSIWSQPENGHCVRLLPFALGTKKRTELYPHTGNERPPSETWHFTIVTGHNRPVRNYTCFIQLSVRTEGSFSDHWIYLGHTESPLWRHKIILVHCGVGLGYTISLGLCMSNVDNPQIRLW